MPNTVIKIYRRAPDVTIPKYGTDWAACFDISAYLKEGDTVKQFGPDNVPVDVVVVEDTENVGIYTLPPRSRALIPTGIIFDLPEWASLRAHPRSGLAVKHGVTLINCEGVIDADYVEETYVTLFNTSDVPFVVKSGDRICQAEIVTVENPVSSFSPLVRPPIKKTNRAGGFGHTGV